MAVLLLLASSLRLFPLDGMTLLLLPEVVDLWTEEAGAEDVSSRLLLFSGTLSSAFVTLLEPSSTAKFASS